MKRITLTALIVSSLAWASVPSEKGERASDEKIKFSPLQLSPDELTDNEVSAIASAISAAVHTVISASADKASAQSTIRGRCKYRQGGCPGAFIELRDSQGRVLDQKMLSSTEGFVFSGLKPGRYALVANYPRYKVKSAERQVFAGSDVLIEIGE